MGDSAMTVIAIFLAAILMFVVPLMATAEQKDEGSNLTVQIATNDFVDHIRTTGMLTQEEYDNFVQTLAATGNSYDVKITVKRNQENPESKISVEGTIGDNVYYTMYTTQVLEEVKTGLVLNEGDIVLVDVENTNVTIAQQIRNFLYRVTGKDTSVVVSSASGIVTSSNN